MIGRRKFYGMMWLVALGAMGVSNAHAFVAEHGPIIAQFIHTMTDNVSWPNVRSRTICSYGHDETSDALADIFRKNQIIDAQNSRKITMAFVDRVELSNVQRCSVLYISRHEERMIPVIVERTKKLPILTVSTIEHFTNLGGMMELRVFRQKLRLRLDKTALQNTGIQLSPVILMSIKPGD